MDAMRQTLPRLQLTVPMPMKTGKVGLKFETFGYFSTSWDANGNTGRFDIDLSDGKDQKSTHKF